MTRTVLVTGGTSGIGHAVAARFAAEQAEVFITGRHADTVEQSAKELGAHGIVCDATDPEQVAELAGRRLHHRPDHPRQRRRLHHAVARRGPSEPTACFGASVF